VSDDARWDGLAALYDAGMAPFERWPVRAWRDRVRSALRGALERRAPGGESRGGSSKSRVLEVGTGTGRNRLPEELRARVVAVDRSADMLRRARRRRGYDAVVVADAEALPFPDGVFAAGAETLVWCEVERPVKALAEVARVLAPSAVFVMLDHVRPPGLLGPVADALSRITGPSMDEWWNRDTRRYVEPAGFRLLAAEDSLGGAVRTLLLEKAPMDEADSTMEGRR